MTVVVRPLATDAEKDAFALLSRTQFSPGAPPEAPGHWRKRIEAGPGFDPSQLRGAFRDGRLLGGYVLFERLLRIGAARLPTACLASVVVDPDLRGQGIGHTLMADLLDHAPRRRQALILLDGISGYYSRFGYVSVMDWSMHFIPRAGIGKLPPSPYSVRHATLDDAPALLALYQRHHGDRGGGFERAVADQRHRLSDLVPGNPPLVVSSQQHDPVLAAAPGGDLRGYMLLAWRQRDRAAEVMADDWPAALALLHAHDAEVAAQAEPSETLRWRLEPGSTLATALADHVLIESRSSHDPDGDWMAQPADLDLLIEGMKPAWQARWRARPSNTPTPPALALEIGDRRYILDLTPPLPLGEGRGEGAPPSHQSRRPAHAAVALSPAQLVQLIFGYRSVAHLLPDLPPDLSAALDTLFPATGTWVPGSDVF